MPDNLTKCPTGYAIGYKPLNSYAPIDDLADDMGDMVYSFGEGKDQMMYRILADGCKVDEFEADELSDDGCREKIKQFAKDNKIGTSGLTIVKSKVEFKIK